MTDSFQHPDRADGPVFENDFEFETPDALRAIEAQFRSLAPRTPKLNFDASEKAECPIESSVALTPVPTIEHPTSAHSLPRWGMIAGVWGSGVVVGALVMFLMVQVGLLEVGFAHQPRQVVGPIEPDVTQNSVAVAKSPDDPAKSESKRQETEDVALVAQYEPDSRPTAMEWLEAFWRESDRGGRDSRKPLTLLAMRLGKFPELQETHPISPPKASLPKSLLSKSTPSKTPTAERPATRRPEPKPFRTNDYRRVYEELFGRDQIQYW